MTSYKREWCIDEIDRLVGTLGLVARETSDNQAAADVSYAAGRLQAVREMLTQVLEPGFSGGFERGKNEDEKRSETYMQHEITYLPARSIGADSGEL